MYAVRNIRLCTKDCLCLYVCPSGATDTETGQIDSDKCIDGCRLCVDACPSHAISLVPEKYPEQQVKNDDVKKSLGQLSKSKVEQELVARALSSSDDPVIKQFAKALELSNRLTAEDLLREAGFMLPQSQAVLSLLKNLEKTSDSETFPRQAFDKLIAIIQEATSE